ncbi:MAG: DNA recombination protein RmuC [Ilumatobacteraceae bacterium]|nr:DNA recombination protein RmuC [Ilumatobacteraceae bacterium]
MEIALVICLVAAVAALTWLVARRNVPVVEPASAPPVSADVISQAAMLAVEHAVTMSHEQLGAHTQASEASLAGRQQLIDQRLGEVQTGVRVDIDRLSQLVQQLGEATSERFGQVDRSLQVHSEITQTLSSTTNSLREALASSNARGQWGERMAEDVLRLAGFHEGVNYHKRTGVVGEGRGIPDFTFLLPRGHVLFMDVKFPMAAYLKYLDANTDAERSAHRATFVRDVRARVRELARREYAATDDRSTIDNVLLFVPNETVSAFIHESDFGLIEEAMASNVVICSPLTLFAFLGVIRQAFDNFVIEETSQEILQLLGKFGQQWGKYTEQIDKVKRAFDTLNRSFDELATTRRRQLERPLNAIEDLRRKQRLPIDGQLFGIDETGEVEAELDNVRELGA